MGELAAVLGFLTALTLIAAALAAAGVVRVTLSKPRTHGS